MCYNIIRKEVKIMTITVKLRNDKKRCTQTFIVERFRVGIDNITLVNAFSLKSHFTYSCIVFNRNDWRTI